MLKKLSVAAAATAIALTAFVSAAPAEAAGIKVGVLTCSVESGWGFIFGSSKDIRCSYSPNHRGHGEHYRGSISKFGVDVGYTESGVIVWAVIAPTSDLKAGALEGDYVGATASATAAVGVGVHALIGGFDKSITLQPISIEGNTGLNIAAGIGAMRLTHAQ